MNGKLQTRRPSGRRTHSRMSAGRLNPDQVNTLQNGVTAKQGEDERKMQEIAMGNYDVMTGLAANEHQMQKLGNVGMDGKFGNSFAHIIAKITSFNPKLASQMEVDHYSELWAQSESKLNEIIKASLTKFLAKPAKFEPDLANNVEIGQYSKLWAQRESELNFQNLFESPKDKAEIETLFAEFGFVLSDYERAFLDVLSAEGETLASADLADEFWFSSN